MAFTLAGVSQNQSIELKSLKVKSPVSRTSEGLGIEVICEVKYAFSIKEFSDRFYEIYPKLTDSNGVILIDSKNIKGYSQANPYDKGKDDFSVFIPYSYLHLSSGQHKCVLELYASHNDSIMPVFYKGEILFNVPVLYKYSEQKINIENFSATIKDKSGVAGIELVFDADFSFPSSKILGADDKTNLKNYCFYATITGQSRPYVFSPDQAPEKYGFYEWNPYLLKEAIEPGKIQKCSLFIPFTKLQILEGNHNLNICLNVTNHNNTVFWKNLAKTNLIIDIPELQITKIAVKGIKIAQGEYDIAGKNIPIVSIFTGGKKKRGLGYPDVMWKVTQGFFTAFSTDFFRNSFSGPDDTCFLKTLGTENIALLVLDFDAVGKDDELGRFSFKPRTGDYKIIHSGLAQNKVLNIDISFSKNTLPKPGNIKILGQTQKLNGCTGLLCKIEGLNIQPDTILSFIPVFIDSAGFVSRPIKNFNSAENKFFIPWFLLEKSSNAGIEFFHPETKETYEIICTSLIEKPKKLHDFSFSGKIKPGFENGLKGIEIKVSANAPDFYKENIEVFEKVFKITDEKDSIPLSFKLKKDLFELAVFVPFCQFEKAKAKLKTNYRIETSNNYVVGDTCIIFDLDVPELLRISLDSISFKAKKQYKKYQTFCWEISHGTIAKASLEEKSAEKKLGWKINEGFEFNAHSEDLVYFELKGLSYFGKETLIETRIITAGELAKHKKGKKKLPGSTFLKSCHFYYLK